MSPGHRVQASVLREASELGAVESILQCAMLGGYFGGQSLAELREKLTLVGSLAKPIIFVNGKQRLCHACGETDLRCANPIRCRLNAHGRLSCTRVLAAHSLIHP